MDRLEQYFDSIIDNYNTLNDEEKDAIRGMKGTAEGNILRKVLGPEIGTFDFKEKSKPMAMPKKRGLATR
jgi:hypothetical protein